ncbi:MAG: 50S ribosome-binding GTPase [Chloroflexota bacterium]|nr:50S ribosome-binding GTPase [Chloroflexota bacterium]
MTAEADASTGPFDLAACETALSRAIEAAGYLGLDVRSAVRVRSDVAERAGFPTDLYVLALAGGTGVGKSSLLNALAGEPISAAGVMRPTTSEPTAWVPAARLSDAAPLLEWLGGAAVRPHGSDALGDLVVMDLPDLDSIARMHRERVDAVLPRIDAVIWVADPEKYQDAILHDGYLRTWVRRLERQAVVLNKVDRLSPVDAESLRRDLAERLEREGLPPLPVLLTSATDGRTTELAEWLAAGQESKRVVRARLAAASGAAVQDLTVRAGLQPGAWRPLVTDEESRAATAAMATRILAIVDLPGLSRQAVEATRLAARPRGGGPLGIVRTVLERGSGVSERRADPQGYLRRWRDRGSLMGASEPLRDLVSGAIAAVPAAIRPTLAALADTGALTTGLGEAVDRAVVSDAARFAAPTSRLWPFLGVAQLLATASLVLGVIWLVALAVGVGQAETPLVEVPLLGQVPLPVALVAGGILGWFVLGRVLLVHAGWLGRRWAARLRERITSEVQDSVRAAALGPLEAFDGRRHDLREAATDAWNACRGEA